MLPMPDPAATPRRRRRQEGQIVVIFAGAILAIIAMCGVVIDVSWYWTNNLRMQRAADAAALAGVVWLPGNPSQAFTAAQNEAIKNGYTNGVGGIVITPSVDPNNNRRLIVKINGPVGTFFSKVVGINSWPAARTAKADYVLPVPMGSPDNYYGVGYLQKAVTTTSTTHDTGNTGLDTPNNTAPSGGQWTPSTTSGGNNITTVVQSNNNNYATENTNGQQQQWANFNLQSGSGGVPTPGANQALTITGLEVVLSDAFLSAACANSTIGVDISWNGGTTWSTRVATPNLGVITSADYTLGSTTSVADWGTHTWVASDFSNTNFRVRLTANKGCATTATFNVDQLQVQVNWDLATTTSTTTIQNVPVDPPAGQSAITRPQGIWGAMQSQGAPSIQGDAFMTKYDTRTSSLNAKGGSDPDTYYDAANFFNYAVEIPAGGGGALWIYDPGFCDTNGSGTGEYWTVGSPNGYGSSHSQARPVSAFYDLFNTHGTLADTSDDGLPVWSSGTTYRRMQFDDHVLWNAQGNTPSFTDCSTLPWHLGWVQVASGLAAGTYRLHTYSTDPSSATDQDNSTGLNTFALYASASGGTPKIYGIGAMEAYVHLPANTTSEFYLAQIDAVHAGKTMEINLWDPGDTGNLAAQLAILQPTGTGFTPVQFSWTATQGNSSGNCRATSGTNVFSVTTNTGGTSNFNGCWLTIDVPLPTTYSAPVDPATGQNGWWKIRYTMGAGSGFATDLTTWKVDIKGNPVHLITP